MDAAMSKGAHGAFLSGAGPTVLALTGGHGKLWVHSTPLHSTPLRSTPLHSTPLHSAPLHFTPLHSTPLRSCVVAPLTGSFVHLVHRSIYLSIYLSIHWSVGPFTCAVVSIHECCSPIIHVLRAGTYTGWGEV